MVTNSSTVESGILIGDRIDCIESNKNSSVSIHIEYNNLGFIIQSMKLEKNKTISKID